MVTRASGGTRAVSTHCLRQVRLGETAGHASRAGNKPRAAKGYWQTVRRSRETIVTVPQQHISE
eukprot:3582053-Alexandrium_andersonii.AAC.1